MNEVNSTDLKSTVEVSETAPVEEGSARRKFFKAAAVTATGIAIGAGLAGPAEAQTVPRSGHIQIVVTEGKVTLDALHAALDEAIALVVPQGYCNCGLTGFDVSFLRGDPALYPLTRIPGVQMGVLTRE